MVQYLEEPVQDTRDLQAYFRQTGIPIGLDETLDEVFAPHGTLPLHQQSGHTAEDRLGLWVSELGKGVVGALVVKPGAVGGFERALDLHRWAAKHGIHVSVAGFFAYCQIVRVADSDYSSCWKKFSGAVCAENECNLPLALFQA